MNNKFFKYLKRDKWFNLHLYLFSVMIAFVTIVLISQKVSSVDNLILVEGNFDSITQRLNIGAKFRKIKYTSRDTLAFIHLKQYHSKFQISYSAYNDIEFMDSVKMGDKIQIHISENDLSKIYNNEKIRGFSLFVNGKKYLDPESAVSGLNGGNRLFLVLSGIILIIVIHYINRNYTEWKKALIVNRGI